MPLIDMTYEELKNYKGCNPKPKDFDDFWDMSIQKAKEVKREVSLKEAEFETSYAKCYDLYFTAVDGSRIHSKLLVPKKLTENNITTNNKEKAPAIIKFHGYKAYSGSWTENLGYVAEGYVFAAMDVRGQGGFSQDIGGTSGTTVSGHIVKGLDDKPEQLFYHNAFLDTAQLAWSLMELSFVDEENISVFGGSQGGALALACSALVKEIKKCVTIYPFLCDYQRVWEMDLAQGPYGGLQTYFRNFDPRHEREEEIFTKLGYIDIQHLAPRIEAKVIHAVGLMDAICPPSSQFAAINKIKNLEKSYIYPDYGHEDLHDFHDIVFTFLTDKR